MSSLLAQKVEFGGGIKPPSTAFSEETPTNAQTITNVELFISNVISVLTVVAGVFFIIYFILGAFKWVTAGGDTSKVGKARDEMVEGVLGLVIVVMSYGLIGVVGKIVGLDLLNPGLVLTTLIPPP